MQRFNSRFRIALLAIAASLLCFASVHAKKPAQPGGGGGGAGYAIIDLPGPYHSANGWSRTFAERISDVGTGGEVYVLGHDYIDDSLPCVWTVDAGGVSVEDLTGLIGRAEDVNSAGIVAGSNNNRPVVLLANNQTVYLEDASLSGLVWTINNADSSGDFQAVGYTDSSASGVTPILWDLNVDGTVWLSTPLINTMGLAYYAHDISDTGLLGGRVIIDNESVPAIGMFTPLGLETSLRANPNPEEITSISEVQVTDDGDLLGDGYEYVGPAGHARAVIWPKGDNAIDLTAETGYTTTGAGIALVSSAMQVVGRAEKDGRGAFAYLYTNGTFSNLGTMSKGDQPWSFDRAEGINTSGMICGVGSVGSRKNRQLHGFLLIPNGQ